jgi:glycosyltransferase involved in cell wall biosynthesis
VFLRWGVFFTDDLMKLLHVTPAYFPFLEKGGPAVKVVAIAEGLARRGHRVTVLTTWHGKPRTTKRVDRNGVEVIYMRPLAGYRNTILNAGLLSFCRKHVRDFDLVHIYGLYDLMSPAVGHYCVRARVPYVLEPLGMSRPIDRSFRLKRVWHRVFGAPLFRHASQVIATSQQEQQELLEDGVPRDQVVLRYNGVDLDDYANLPPRGVFRAKWGISPDEPVVLFLGRLIPRKGVDLLITSFAQACPESGRLVVAGPEGEPNIVQQMRALARAEGIESRVIFTGTLYGDEKKSALVDCDVFVLASRYENFANSVAEAIACGRPVIVTDRCGISEFVAGEAGLVIPREKNALTDALRLLLTDRPLYQRFQQACPRVAARLGWQEMLNRQESLYAGIRTTQKAP